MTCNFYIYHIYSINPCIALSSGIHASFHMISDFAQIPDNTQLSTKSAPYMCQNISKAPRLRKLITTNSISVKHSWKGINRECINRECINRGCITRGCINRGARRFLTSLRIIYSEIPLDDGIQTYWTVYKCIFNLA